MELLDFDLFPFIETSDGTASFPLSSAALCLATALLWNLIYRKSVELLADKKKAARIAPLLHAIWATGASVYIVYYHSPLLETPSTICVPLGPSQREFPISLGYFLWDLLICLKEGWSLDWVIHAVFCVLMYGMGTLLHGLYRWGCMVLFYEFSTIFLHCYIFLYYAGHDALAAIVKLSASLAHHTSLRTCV